MNEGAENGSDFASSESNMPLTVPIPFFSTSTSEHNNIALQTGGGFLAILRALRRGVYVRQPSIFSPLPEYLTSLRFLPGTPRSIVQWRSSIATVGPTISYRN